MAITIVQDLQAVPDEVRVPGRLRLLQTLRCLDRDAEEVSVLYLLDGAHDVWFQRADRTLSKALKLTTTVRRDATAVQHDIALARGAGRGRMALIEIEETIESLAPGPGLALSSVVVVRLAVGA